MRTSAPKAPDPFESMVVGAGLAAGAANVIMQLSHPGVGYGVVESRVDSGNLFRHPVKRTRTTITYLAVATLGTDEEKTAYRREVNRQHAQVRSTDESPVRYNAFDPQLQLWVAACLYKGFEDGFEALNGTIPDELRESAYAASEPLGTTLQVRPDMWPQTRAEFQQYWDASIDEVSVDDTVREHLLAIAALEFLPRVLSVPFGPLNRFVTTGFLPPQFRRQMHLRWTDHDQRRFDRLMSAIGAIAMRLPRPLRQFPYNLAIWDLRRRRKAGTALV